MSSWALVCPHLPLHATREQLQTQHQAQRPSVALILLQLPQMTALFSTTKPYIAHTGPATLARSWLIHHSRTYVCPPLLGQEAQILQLSPQNLKTRLCTVSPTPHSPLHTVDPSLVSTLCRILVCRSCCSLGRPGTFFKQLRHHLSDIAFPGLLKGFSPLRPTFTFMVGCRLLFWRKHQSGCRPHLWAEPSEAARKGCLKHHGNRGRTGLSL